MSSPALTGEMTVSESPASVAQDVANWLKSVSADAISRRGRFTIALAGGSTPKLLYELLAQAPHREGMQWEQWQVFFGDERACPPDDPSSNVHMARQALLDHVAIASENVHPMPADSQDLARAAAGYSFMLETLLGDTDEVPRLDCVLLGLGENGHTASLFPGDAALLVADAWCTVGHADYAPTDRLTLTYPAINAARNVAFIVTGSKKANALRGVIEGTVPAAAVNPTQGQLLWFLDQEASDSMAT